MKFRSGAISALATLIAASGASGQTFRSWADSANDAVVRRTDPGAVLPINPDSVLPDLTNVVISGWEPTDPVNDPFTGAFINTEDAHIFRLDIIFAGLVNPPGGLGLGGTEWMPFQFGNSPVYGFLDLDVDSKKDTGGELTRPAEQRYLANIARFGRVPEGSISERVARSRLEIDSDFFTQPYYERTGADYAVALCGCWTVEPVFLGGNGDEIFEEGETWLVRGRFLERAQGYVDASQAFGGSNSGHYDPLTIVQFRHDLASDTTSITLVKPLDMIGAAMLRGEPEQPINFSLFDHTAVIEALADIIEGAGGNLVGPVEELTRRWKDKDPEDSLDVSDWEATGLFGTTYETNNFGHSYVWTDTGFDETPGDVDGDGFANNLDQDALRAHVYANDGGPDDADGTKNGRFVIKNIGTDFSLYDLDGNYIVEPEDLWLYGHRADLDGNGILNVFDFLLYQSTFVAGLIEGDFNLDESLDLFDFLAFQDAFTRP